MPDIAAEIGVAENGKAAALRFVMSRRFCIVIPRARKLGDERGGQARARRARGVSCNCCTTHAAISPVCWRASLLYYITKRAGVPFGRVRKCRTRETTTSTDAAKSTRQTVYRGAELRQLDKTATSSLVRINPDGIVAFLRP